MELFEKVCKGLECCLPETQEQAVLSCADCPYDPCSGSVSLPISMIDDVRKLITAQRERIKELEAGQTARVMTLEEAKQAEAGTVVWLEWRIESKINSAIFFRLINKGIDDSLEFHVLDCFVAARMACYGTEWRCWTQRPTDEQREEVKWDD